MSEKPTHETRMYEMRSDNPLTYEQVDALRGLVGAEIVSIRRNLYDVEYLQDLYEITDKLTGWLERHEPSIYPHVAIPKTWEGSD